MSTNKHAAQHFLELCVAGKVDEAYRKYVDVSGKHHNVFFPKGFSALQQAMKENPSKHIEIRHVLEEGDLIAVHSKVVMTDDQEVSVVHLFKFQNGRIVEMWDVGQLNPKDSPNEDGAF